MASLPEHAHKAAVNAEFDAMVVSVRAFQSSRASFLQSLTDPATFEETSIAARAFAGARPSNETQDFRDVTASSVKAVFRLDVHKSSVSHRWWELRGFVRYNDGGTVKRYRRRHREGLTVTADSDYELIRDEEEGL